MPQVEDLARLSFKRQPLYVGIDDSKAASTREGLEQGYCCVASEKRVLLLFTFLKKNANRKVCAPLPVVMLQPSTELPRPARGCMRPCYVSGKHAISILTRLHSKVFMPPRGAWFPPICLDQRPS